MKTRNLLWSFVAIIMVTMLSVGLSSCKKSEDGDNGGNDGGNITNAPAGLIGTWYKTSGASKYSLNFTFKSNGTGEGKVEHNNIISYSTFAFTYTYKSNGDVTCKYTRIAIDEDGEQTGSGTMTFNYSNNKLTFTDAPNTSWIGAVFTKD